MEELFQVNNFWIRVRLKPVWNLELDKYLTDLQDDPLLYSTCMSLVDSPRGHVKSEHTCWFSQSVLNWGNLTVSRWRGRESTEGGKEGTHVWNITAQNIYPVCEHLSMFVRVFHCRFTSNLIYRLWFPWCRIKPPSCRHKTNGHYHDNKMKNKFSFCLHRKIQPNNNHTRLFIYWCWFSAYYQLNIICFMGGICQEGTVHVIYGFLEEPLASLEQLNLSRIHTGMQTVLMLRPDTLPPILPPDVRTLDVLSPNVIIPHQETTYWCYIQKLPENMPKNHIVMVWMPLNYKIWKLSHIMLHTIISEFSFLMYLSKVKAFRSRNT